MCRVWNLQVKTVVKLFSVEKFLLISAYNPCQALRVRTMVLVNEIKYVQTRNSFFCVYYMPCRNLKSKNSFRMCNDAALEVDACERLKLLPKNFL